MATSTDLNESFNTGYSSESLVLRPPTVISSAMFISTDFLPILSRMVAKKRSVTLFMSDPDVIWRGQPAPGIPSVDCAGGLDQQDMTFLLRYRFMLHTFGNDIHLILVQGCDP